MESPKQCLHAPLPVDVTRSSASLSGPLAGNAIVQSPVPMAVVTERLKRWSGVNVRTSWNKISGRSCMRVILPERPTADHPRVLRLRVSGSSVAWFFRMQASMFGWSQPTARTKLSIKLRGGIYHVSLGAHQWQTRTYTIPISFP